MSRQAKQIGAPWLLDLVIGIVGVSLIGFCVYTANAGPGDNSQANQLPGHQDVNQPLEVIPSSLPTSKPTVFLDEPA